MASLIGQRVAGRYLIRSLVGEGGVGTVYCAVQEPLERLVALKTLRPEFAQHPAARRRFVREARAVAALSHPSIAAVHDFGVTDDDVPYIAMEFVEGAPLDTLLAARPFDFEAVRGVFDQILAALAHAHARGVIHRDVKPANVLVVDEPDGQPRVKLVDFGIATLLRSTSALDDTLTSGSHWIGTPHFMAPELAERSQITPSAVVDVYSVGVMLYWAICGRYPFDGDNAIAVLMAHCQQPFPAVVPRPGVALPAALEGLLKDALSKRVETRIPSANAFRTRLLSLISREADDPGALRVPMPPRRQTLVEARLGTLAEPGAAPRQTLIETPAPGAQPSHEAPRRPPRSAPLALIEREVECARVQSAAQQAIFRRPMVFTVEGERGLGKSRLARWASETLAETLGFLTLRASFPQSAHHRLEPLRDLFLTLLAARGVEASALSAHIESRLGAFALPPRDLEALVSLLAPPSEAPEGATAAVAFARHQGGPMRGDEGVLGYVELLLTLLDVFSTRQPLLVVLEDLHLAGVEAGSLIDHLARSLAARECSVVLLLTLAPSALEGGARPLEATLARLAHPGLVQRIILAPLSAEGARRLLGALLPAEAPLAEALIERGGGNPAYLVELVRYLQHEALLQPTGDGDWRARSRVNVSAVLPPDLVALFTLRLAQLEQPPQAGPRRRALLDRAAILGARFRFSVLEAMIEKEGRDDLVDDLDEDIDAILDADMLRMTELRDDDLLTFSSSLLRDVLLKGLEGRRNRRRLHRGAAEAKLAVARDVDAVAAEVVEHFAIARDRDRELEFTRRAADFAERSHDPLAATRHLEHALTLIADYGDPERDAALAAQLQLRAALLAIGLGRHEQAATRLEALVSHGEVSPRQRWRAMVGLGEIARRRAALEEASARFSAALALAASLDGEAQTRALLGLAHVELQRSRHDDARRHLASALETAERVGDPALTAETLWLSGEHARAEGELGQADVLLRDALARYEALDHRQGIASCHAQLAMLARMRDDLDGAERAYLFALERYRAMGQRREVAAQLNGLGDVARFKGDFALARERYRSAYQIFEALKLPQDAALALTNLGLAALDDARLGIAEEALDDAMSIAEDLDAPYLRLGLELNLACLHARLDHDAAADRWLDAALMRLDATRLVDPDFARPLERLAALSAQAGLRDRAVALYTRVLEMWRELGRPADQRRVEDALAAVVAE